MLIKSVERERHDKNSVTKVVKNKSFIISGNSCPFVVL